MVEIMVRNHFKKIVVSRLQLLALNSGIQLTATSSLNVGMTS